MGKKSRVLHAIRPYPNEWVGDEIDEERLTKRTAAASGAQHPNGESQQRQISSTPLILLARISNVVGREGD